jgi:NADH-quinone oxidoreductase subunit D
MANGTLVSDAGAWQTPLLYMFREREKILDLFEMACGARLTTNYMRIGGVAFDPPTEFWPALRELVDELPERIDEYGQLLKENEVFIARTRNVGIISAEDAINGSLTGPALRGSGVPWDLRKAEPYDVYDRFDFDIVVGRTGDVYDRFMVRMEETRQSARILRQAIDQVPEGPHKNEIPLALRPEPGEVYARSAGGKSQMVVDHRPYGLPGPILIHPEAREHCRTRVERERLLTSGLGQADIEGSGCRAMPGQVSLQHLERSRRRLEGEDPRLRTPAVDEKREHPDVRSHVDDHRVVG